MALEARKLQGGSGSGCVWLLPGAFKTAVAGLQRLMQVSACAHSALIVLQRVKGVPRVWKVKAELREQHDLPEELPEELVSLAQPLPLAPERA